jgi:hypothetical protein
MKLALTRRRIVEEELTSTTEGVQDAAMESRLQDLHTGCVGIVESFSGTAQTAVVLPAIKRIFLDHGAVELPALVDCPVHFPGGGDYVLTTPPAKGDECWLAFSERALDFWFTNGGVQLPSDMRMHDYSDAVAFVGIRSQPRKLTDFNTSAAELRTVDGSMRIRLEPALISLGAGGVIPLTAFANGVLTKKDIDPILEVPYGVLGLGSNTVVAKP